ncbi:MAG: 4-alpha-glucanotransferase [Bacteroidales bacterium]|nr:4-alpha-glucanotransferase [Bacteroidales bacterium]
MKLIFYLYYKSEWGQTVCLSGSAGFLGNWNDQSCIQMQYAGHDLWKAEIMIDNLESFHYKYLLSDQHGHKHWEPGTDRIARPDKRQNFIIRDTWQSEFDPARVLMSKVFTEVMMKPSGTIPFEPDLLSNSVVRFNMAAPRVAPGFALGIIGNLDRLGRWSKPVIMSNEFFPYWQIDICLDQGIGHLRYKYVIVELSTNNIVTWEEGFDRELSLDEPEGDNALIVQHDKNFRYPFGDWKGAGVAIPVFSLRTRDSFGVGEFSDLKKLVDWCKQTGIKIIQILPVNETVATHSWLDSYPYKSISVKALHPMYLNLEKLGKLNDRNIMDEFEQKRRSLNELSHVDYVEVTKAKARYFKLIFDQNWSKVSKTKLYKDFFRNNEEWLVPYAAFCYLRDQYKTSNFRLWEGYADYDSEKIAELTHPKQDFHEHIAVHYFIQYHLDIQLREAVEYAHENRIGLKGDIPIGISPDSIEAWTEPKLFNLNGQAGAPPDDFAIMGQNWGFPTYNWDEMARDGYSWWKGRLKMMEQYFDAYRIDHILGFFRIWEIPQTALHGLLGYFKPGLPMSASEIESRGVWFDYDRMVKPYIRGHFLRDFFGDFADEVRLKYLNELEYNVFELKPEYDNQKKIQSHFTPEGETRNITLKEVMIRDGLMGLLDEVLFIRDPYSETPAYHPRIALHYTYTYRELDSHGRNKMNDLYIHFFYRRHDEFWKQQAMNKLPGIVKASNMLVCGEDLGMIPESVPEVMARLNILSLEIQRMPKNPKIEFSHPSDAPYLSVCTTSTHDMSTVRGWWEEDREKTQRFYRTMLGHNDLAPFYAEPWLCREIVNQHLHSPAMWTIFPIQDLIAMDGNMRWDQTDKERINVPSNPENKWRYRMILSLEELLQATDFNELIRGMIHISGRDAD